ncbi:hypothetical protein D8674_012020 [Pyrus ussuriensis x Pyrus communis]|uniref:Uncharacterized protein n=1 Tax=Pyrus ussuriensis x Pyrus communis TaxID=2448454 RepID=A0A5N5G5X6_9ROSA|nr:hypothetical protein D8674_012020 [Pyrus ussuriensis x Pyrus communis]
MAYGFPLMNDNAWVKWINELEPIFKRKWMNNGIYELIIFSKTIVIAKPELLTIALLFWNSGTNTFDFKMGFMSPTILDIVQVFGLRPPGRIVDVTHESSGTSTSPLQLEYNSVTFKSYETSFKGFIPFVKKNFGADSSNANLDQEHIEKFINFHSDRYERRLEVYHPNFCIRQLGFRQAVPIPFFDFVHYEEAVNALILQEALVGGSKLEEEPEARIQVSCWARETMPEPEQTTLIRKKTRAQTSKISKTSITSIDAAPVARVKKQMAYKKSIPLVVTHAFQFDPSTGKKIHFVEDDNNSLFRHLLLMHLKPLKCLLPNLRVLEKHVKKRAKTTVTAAFIPTPAIFFTLLTEAAYSAMIEGVKDAPSASSASSLPELNQYESFLSFFEILRVLRDQHHKPELMEERIAMVDFEIQHLEEQLSLLRAEKVTLTNRLSQKVEEMEKIS